MLNERDDQINLLAAVLHASETEAANEVIEQTDAIEAHIKQTSSKRSIGSMSALSGAKGMTHMEYSTKKSTGKKPIGGGKLSKLRKLK